MSEAVVELRDVFGVHRTNEGDAAALAGTNLELDRKGYGERVGLTLGLLLSVLGLLVVLVLPARPGSRWQARGWLPRRRRPL